VERDVDAPPPSAAPSTSLSTVEADELGEKLKSLDPKTNPHLAKAMEFCEVAGVKSLMAQQADQLVPLVVELMQNGSSDKDTQHWADVRQAMASQIKGHLDDLILLSADVYSDHFSDAELDELIAFYKSDVGKKYLAERPALVAEEGAVAQFWGKAVAEQYLKQQESKQPNASKSSL
jgi:hypothetical protein